MDTFVQEISKFIADSGHGVEGTTIFKGILPAEPDFAIQVLDTPGDDPLFQMGADIQGVIEQPRFQILVRSADPLQARVVAAGIWQDLAAVTNQVVNGTYYLRIEPRQSPFMIENDDSERTRIVCNYQAIREPVVV